MELGIFAKTFETTSAQSTLQAVAAAGFTTAQLNMVNVGLASMPDIIASNVASSVHEAVKSTNVGIAAVSGTYNMIHPDPEVRVVGMRRLEVLAAACSEMQTPMITLCTGTRDPKDQWRWNRDNSSAEAWSDLVKEITTAVEIAERYKVILGIEPELANVVSSADHARKILDEIGSPRLRIVLDPANLFEIAEPKERRVLVEHAIDILNDDIVMAHAKDRRADGSFISVGKGVVDFPHFVAALRSICFDGPLITHGLVAAEAEGAANFLSAILAETASA